MLKIKLLVSSRERTSLFYITMCIRLKPYLGINFVRVSEVKSIFLGPKNTECIIEYRRNMQTELRSVVE